MCMKLCDWPVGLRSRSFIKPRGEKCATTHVVFKLADQWQNMINLLDLISPSSVICRFSASNAILSIFLIMLLATLQKRVANNY